MENKPSIENEPPLSHIEEYYSDWDYNPGELLKLAIWHKKELPPEAVDKIRVAIDKTLGRDESLGHWELDQKEFEILLEGFIECRNIPKELIDDLLEIFRQYKEKQAKKSKTNS